MHDANLTTDPTIADAKRALDMSFQNIEQIRA